MHQLIKHLLQCSQAYRQLAIKTVKSKILAIRKSYGHASNSARCLTEFIIGCFDIPWSIERVVRQDEKKWKNFNHHRSQLSPSYLGKQLQFAGEHPVRFSVSLFVLIGCVWILAQILPSEWIAPDWSKWQAAEQLTYFSTLWTVQATLAALVYPIVIAFVTVFLQRRPAAEAFVHLYILDSGALAAGLSSLALVLVMAAQYLLIPFYGAQSLPIWVALDGAWFLLNAALTTYFLFRTVEFLRPEVQQQVIQRYAVSVALPRDVKRLNLFQVLEQAQREGWIPAPRLYEGPRPEGPTVLLGRFGMSDGESQSTYRVPAPIRLINVRLILLRIVVATWMHSARKWPQSTNKYPFSRRDNPFLTIPMMPGSVYHESFSLATVESGPPLAWWQRRLLRFAYVFRPTSRERFGIQVKSILVELETDAKLAASEADVEAFERAYDSLVGIHELLIGASITINDDGTIGSWALLPDVQHVFGRRLHQRWTESYRSIFSAAIDSIPQNTRPLRRLCHLVQHLAGADLNSSPVEIRENLLELPPLMMHLLGEWWAKKVEEQGTMEHGHSQRAVLRPPLFRVYEEVISTFAGGWESARTTLCKVPDSSKDFEWSMVGTFARLNTTHIDETARMLLATVARGDRTGAEWMADVLSKWWGTFDYEQEPIGLLGKTTYTTLDDVYLEWDILAAQLDITDQVINWSGGKVKTIQRGLLIAVVKNYWTDIQILVVELLLASAQSHLPLNPKESLALEIASGMLMGKQWRDGGRRDNPLAALTGSDYMEAIFRQYAANGRLRSGYAGRLSHFIERIKREEGPEMVSSRVYSGFGADDLDSLQRQQLLLIAVMSDSDSQIPESLKRQVGVWLSSRYSSIEILRQKIKDWLKHLDGDPEISQQVLPALLLLMNKSVDVTACIANVRRSIESLDEIVETMRSDALVAEPIDPERLLEISRYASSKAFYKETGSFPLHLFKNVHVVIGQGEDFILSMNQVRKGELTKTEMDQRASNEDEFWASTLAQHVGAVLIADVLSKCNKRDLFVPDAEAYWSALKTEAALIVERGAIPIMIVDNATRPEWIWQWQQSGFRSDLTQPEDLRIQRYDGQGNGYICNFNDIRVYVAPVVAGASILVADSAFKDASFQKFSNGTFIETSVKDRGDSKLLVDLNLKFSRFVDVGSAEIVRLNYSTESLGKMMK
ncbi:hypothetical protein [Pseudomonas mandelii]